LLVVSDHQQIKKAGAVKHPELWGGVE